MMSTHSSGLYLFLPLSSPSFPSKLKEKWSRSVHRRWIAAGNYELQIDDVKDEIWDMVKPQNPKFITFDDLLQCQQGHTVASMLIDVGGFWTHDNRETLAAQQDAERE